MSRLFSSITIKNVTLRNRIVVSPMCEYSSKDGFANAWHMVHLGSRAVGGAGLVITEATAVSPEGRISVGDLGIWKDEHTDRLRDIVNFIEEQGAVAGIQLAHAGRKASFDIPWKNTQQLTTEQGGWETLAPTAIPFNVTDKTPVALGKDGIAKVREDFRSAAIRAAQAGFKVIEIHAAHGYLLHQFLSPLSNQRTDAYGGTFENRTRLLLEVTKAIREVWPTEHPLFVRISATDWAQGGWDAEDAIRLSEILRKYDVDLIDCSSGGLTTEQKIPVFPGYQVEFADRIKNTTGLLTGAVGLITTAHQAEEILEKNRADLILLAREFLRDPYFPLHAAKELGEDIKWPSQYERAKPR